VQRVAVGRLVGAQALVAGAQSLADEGEHDVAAFLPSPEEAAQMGPLWYRQSRNAKLDRLCHRGLLRPSTDVIVARSSDNPLADAHLVLRLGPQVKR
jgi:hypothetical protein